MKWVANIPVVSSVLPRLSAHDYGTDIANPMTFENGDLKTVSGLDNFVQHVGTSVLTPKSAQWDFGFKHQLFESVDKATFMAESESLAKQMVSQFSFDLIFKKETGLGQTIESIESIEKLTIDNRNCLKFVMKVTGLDEPLEVNVFQV